MVILVDTLCAPLQKGTRCSICTASKTSSREPSSTVRLHNGILAANNSDFANQCRLIWDSENLGQYDLNAKTVELAKSFFQTRLDEKTIAAAEHTFAAGPHKTQNWDVKLPVGTYADYLKSL